MEKTKTKFPQAEYSTEGQIQELLNLAALVGLPNAAQALKGMLTEKTTQKKEKQAA